MTRTALFLSLALLLIGQGCITPNDKTGIGDGTAEAPSDGKDGVKTKTEDTEQSITAILKGEEFARNAPAPSKESKPDLLSPDEVLDIIERSPIQYLIDPEANGARSDLAPYGKGGLSPYLTTRPEDGQPKLFLHEPPQAIKDTFDRANAAYGRKDFKEAVRLFEEAIRLDPSYAKSHTYLGNTHFALQDYKEAVRYLKQALDRNPNDYQAHFFLADAFHMLGDDDMAVAHITMAFVLNKNNPYLRQALDRIVLRAGFQVRPDRLVIPARIDVLSGREISVSSDRDPAWMAWGLCAACWAMEDACRARDGSKDPLGALMHRECLIHQAMTVDAMTERRVPVSEQSQRTRDAINDGFLEAIVFWEIIGSNNPEVMLLLPPQEHQRIAAYILRYVYEPLSNRRDML